MPCASTLKTERPADEQESQGATPARPSADGGLFGSGPPCRLGRWLGTYPCSRRRVARITLIAWLPLGLLSAVQDPFLEHSALASFLSDIAVHARGLVTLPLLLAAEALLAPRLEAIGMTFLGSELVTDAHRGRFASAATSTRQLRGSLGVELGIVALTAATLATLALSVPGSELPGWQVSGGEGFSGLSLAGLWHLTISLPLLLVLLLGWSWRLVLWTRFLWLVSRLDLRLVPAHPDRAAGLLFLAASVRAFALLGTATGAAAAGTLANAVVHGDIPPLVFKNFVIAYTLSAAAVFIAPLAVFHDVLIRQWRRGIVAYGALATEVGHSFERKWLWAHRPGEEALRAPDFSAEADLSSVVGNVYQMRLLPLDLKSAALVLAATSLPFVPVMLLGVSFETILDGVARLLL